MDINSEKAILIREIEKLEDVSMVKLFKIHVALWLEARRKDQPGRNTIKSWKRPIQK
jgi:hypothetical protein